MAGHVLQGPILSTGGKSVGRVNVQVIDAETDVPAEIYADREMVCQLLNPFDADYFYRCYVRSGRYHVYLRQGPDIVQEYLDIEVGQSYVYEGLLTGSRRVISQAYWDSIVYDQDPFEVEYLENGGNPRWNLYYPNGVGGSWGLIILGMVTSDFLRSLNNKFIIVTVRAKIDNSFYFQYSRPGRPTYSYGINDYKYHNILIGVVGEVDPEKEFYFRFINSNFNPGNDFYVDCIDITLYDTYNPIGDTVITSLFFIGHLSNAGLSPHEFTVTGSVASAGGQFGDATSFDGGHIAVTIYHASPEELMFGSGDFTVELWLKPAALPASGRLYIVGNRFQTEPDKWGLSLRTDGALVFGCGSTELATSISLVLDEWVHVAFVRSSGELRAYVGGVLCGDLNSVNVIKSLSSVLIGGADYGANYIGLMEQLRITKGAGLYVDEFTPGDLTL